MYQATFLPTVPEQVAIATVRRNNATLINQDSGNFEYYTDPQIVSAARELMERIDLDPASSAKANESVKATYYYTVEDDGLSQHWFGKIWMNHPFGRGRNSAWITKLVTEYEIGDVDEAVCITFNSTSERWFDLLFSYPQCYLSPRTNYFLPDGTKKVGVTKGSVITYFGINVTLFRNIFKPFGRITLPEWRFTDALLDNIYLKG